MGRLVRPAGPFSFPGTGELRWPAFAALALLAVLCFANSFPGSFIGDDLAIVRDSPLVRVGDLAGIAAADYWGEGAGSGLHRPLTILTYAANRALFGPGPASFHAVNVLLHAGVSVLVAATLGGAGVAAGACWWAGAIFAVHPIHTEVVDVVTGRAELLAALFALLTVLGAARRTRGGAALAFGAFAAGLLSKESAIVALPLVVVVELWRGGAPSRLVRERGGLLAGLGGIALAWLALRAWGLPGSGLPANALHPIDNPLVLLEPAARVLTALKVQGLYLARLAFPGRLDAVFVDTMIGPVVAARSAAGAAVVVGAGALFAAAAAGWRRRAAWSLGAAIYAVAFAVTANLFFATPFLMAERFAYLPSAGFALALAAAVPAVFARVGAGRGAAAGRMLLALFVVGCGARTLARNADFRTPLALWTAETRREPGNVRAWVYLAGAREDGGDPAGAEQALRRAIDLRPEFVEPHLSLGFLLLNDRRPYEAAGAFDRVLRLVPGESPLAMTGMALAFLDAGKPAEARQWLDAVPAYFRGRPLYVEAGSRAAAAGRARP
jgi:tetratricopeptide (TPR) repeat protein